MSKINFPKKQEQRLIPKYLLEYTTKLEENHPDPSASWGGGSGGDYTAGEGIIIENNEISVDSEDVAMVQNLATVAFSGSYSDLSNKPDLSVYELKTDAFTGNYNDLTNKPDLSVYELKTDAFSGDYNDLTNKPTIPDAVSGTNDGTNWTTITIGNTTKAIPSGGSTYTAGTGIDITNNTISIDNTVALKSELFSGNYNDLTNKPDLSVYAETSDLGTAAFIDEDSLVIDYSQLTNTPTIPVVPTNISAFTNDVGYITGINNSMVISALGYTPGTSNFSGDYDDLTDKPTIPTDTSDLTNGAGFITSSALSGYATETWVGNQGYITGITSSDVTTALGYTPGTSNFSGDYDDLTDKPDLSIYAQSANLATVATSGSYNDLSNKPSIPSTATSTSTVTPTTSAFMTSTTKTTETLTFTYTDNTTANITIVTSVTDNTSNAMTGATVSTTTTLS